jgi:hypothetical protein
MWFRTRAGLVCIQVPVEITLYRFTRSDQGKSIGVVANQPFSPESTFKQEATQVNISNRPVYLVCFQDDDNAAAHGAECMSRIEAAVRNQEVICDLSDLGDDIAWGTSNDIVLVQWLQAER